MRFVTQTTMPPSGEQFEIAAGGHRAVVVTVGGGLRSYAVDGRDVVDGYAVDRMADGGRGQTLAPWPNPVEEGAGAWRGEEPQLPPTEPAQPHPDHGLVGLLRWVMGDRAGGGVP